MRLISFDLQQMQHADDFYRQFAARFTLSAEFGANLDALWDAITGEIALPVRITLRHLQQHPYESEFLRILSVLQEAQQETGGAFSVRVSGPGAH